MPIQQEIAEQLDGHWKTGMCTAPCESPLQFCAGSCCICCAVWQQRTELLQITGEPYVCCAGLCPCGPLGEPQDQSCLFLEACCCPGLALSGNRFMVQTRFNKENTPCDDCILWFTCLFTCAVDIARCFMDVPDGLELLADCLTITVQGCMHAQQAIEIEEIKKTGYQGPPPNIVGLLSPCQQSMIQKGGGGGGMQPPQMMGMPQQGMPQQGMPQQGGVQIQCGGCQQIFGSPGQGVTVACPHCGTHNQC